MSETNGTPLPPAGWYADPSGSPQLRWWDGARWSEHTSPAPSSGYGAAPQHDAAAAPGQPGPAPHPGQQPPQAPQQPYPGQPAQQQPYPPQPQHPRQPAPYVAPPYGQQAPAAPQYRPQPLPRVAPGTPVYTPYVWILAVLPVLSLVLLSTVDFRRIALGPLYGHSFGPGPMYFAMVIVNWLLYGATVVLAYFDWRELGRRGFAQPFHWAWAFLSSIVYLIGRPVVVKRRGGAGSFWPLWIVVALGVGSMIVAIVKVVDLIGVMLQMQPGMTTLQG